MEIYIAQAEMFYAIIIVLLTLFSYIWIYMSITIDGIFEYLDVYVNDN